MHRMTLYSESQPVAWLLQWPYKPPKGSVPTDGIETLALRFHLLRRFPPAGLTIPNTNTYLTTTQSEVVDH